MYFTAKVLLISLLNSALIPAWARNVWAPENYHNRLMFTGACRPQEINSLSSYLNEQVYYREMYNLYKDGECDYRLLQPFLWKSPLELSRQMELLGWHWRDRYKDYQWPETGMTFKINEEGDVNVSDSFVVNRAHLLDHVAVSHPGLANYSALFPLGGSLLGEIREPLIVHHVSDRVGQPAIILTDYRVGIIVFVEGISEAVTRYERELDLVSDIAAEKRKIYFK